VRLKLNGIGARVRDRIDEGMRHSQAAVVRLRDFADNRAGGRNAHRRASDPRLSPHGMTLRSGPWRLSMRPATITSQSTVNGSISREVVCQG
jgi:hypothetical protein